MKKVFFFDIDDTLLPTGEEGISKENIEAIKKLKQNYDVYIATGKSLDMAKDVLKLLDVNMSITSNGSVIVENGDMIYSRHIEDEDINRIAKIIENKPNIVLGGQGNEGSYVLDQGGEIYNKYICKMFEDLSVDIPKQVDHFEEKIYQLWFLGEIEGVVVNDEKFDTFRWNENGLDIVYKNTSKAQGINYLLDNKYKGQEIEIYAFGDSLNDVQMFKLAKFGVAMSNAKDELKAVATHITDNADNKGVYNFLKENDLI